MEKSVGAPGEAVQSKPNKDVSPLSLTEERLASFQEYTMPNDQKYAEYAVRQEAAQAYERASYDRKLLESNDTDHVHAGQPRDGDMLESVCRLYREEPSSAGPMQRFATLSSVTAPLPLLARSGMAKAGVDVGSLESLERRDAAAKALTIPVDQAKESSEEPELTYADCLRVAREKYGSQEGAKPRTERRHTIAKRRRRSGSADAEGADRMKQQKIRP